MSWWCMYQVQGRNEKTLEWPRSNLTCFSQVSEGQAWLKPLLSISCCEIVSRWRLCWLHVQPLPPCGHKVQQWNLIFVSESVHPMHLLYFMRRKCGNHLSFFTVCTLNKNMTHIQPHRRNWTALYIYYEIAFQFLCLGREYFLYYKHSLVYS